MTDTTLFPYDLLEEFGLTQSMIDDLPENVLETLYSGGRSPLLPIIVKTDNQDVKIHAKFRLIATSDEEGKMGVVFYPRLTEAPLDDFTDEQKQELLSGNVIIADMLVGGREQGGMTQCFVQIDKDTNHVFYVPTPVIGRNLRGIDEIVNLSADDYMALKSGKVITVEEPELMSIGIDLFTEAGVFVCNGDTDNWRRVVGSSLPKFNFGIDGCWVNEHGELNYVKEEDYTPEIIIVQQKLVEKYERAAYGSGMEDIDSILQETADNSNQISR